MIGTSAALGAIESHGAARPAALAVVGDGYSISYGSLMRSVDRLEHEIRRRVAGVEPVVGVCLGRGAPAIIAMLAVMRAGATYFPLDETLPAGLLERMLKVGDPALIIACDATAVPLPAAAQVLVYTPDPQDVSDDPFKPDPVEIDSESLAYLVFTSGTTGVPKGIEVPWRTLDHLVSWTLKINEPAERCAQIASLAFDVSIQETFATLSAGGTLIVADSWTRRDPVALLNFFVEHGVSSAHLAPAMLRQLAEVWSESGIDSALRRVYAAGEALHVTPSVRKLIRSGRLAVLQNEYGMSEAQVVSVHRLTGGSTEIPAFPPIGRCVDDSVIYILDKQLRPVGSGEVGEIYVGGISLARGYRSLPRLTAQQFLPDPYADVAGARMYRSGDLGRLRDDGHLECLGRADDQVELRGFRVEPRQVDAVLAEEATVSESVTVAVTSASGELALRSYVRLASGVDSDNAKSCLRDHLRQLLPEHMVPAATVFVDSLPRNSNGKVDVSALDAFVSEHTVPETSELEREHTDLKRVLIRLFCKVLDLTTIGVDEDFRNVGGHSLSASRLAVLIQRDLGVPIGVRDVLKLGTVEAISAFVETAAATRHGEVGADAD